MCIRDRGQIAHENLVFIHFIFIFIVQSYLCLLYTSQIGLGIAGLIVGYRNLALLLGLSLIHIRCV